MFVFRQQKYKFSSDLITAHPTFNKKYTYNIINLIIIKSPKVPISFS